MQANTNVVNLGEKDIRQRLQEALQRYGYKQVDVSKETGIHHSTLSLWLQGKIKGHFVKIEENIQEWLENLQANKPRFSKNSSSKFVQIRSNPVNIDKLTAPDQLLPIRIDLDMEGRKYRDLIVWNLNEPYFTAEQFAKLVSEENNLSANFETEITNLIKRSISNYESVDQLKDECIKTIEIDVRVDNICVKDKFEWDISDNENSPEDFSELICNELGLSHEFSTQIAHQIREQKKHLNEPMGLSWTDGMTRGNRARSGVNPMLKMNEHSRIDPVTTDNYLRPVSTVYYGDNDNLSSWEPVIQTFTLDEIKKHEQLEERKYRHERRGIRYN